MDGEPRPLLCQRDELRVRRHIGEIALARGGLGVRAPDGFDDGLLSGAFTQRGS